MKTSTTQPPAAGEAAHTPTPWAFTHKGNPVRGRGQFLTVVQHDDHDELPIADVNRHRGPASQANAAFIVRACNSHAALVERLERNAEHFDGIAKWFDQFDHWKSAEQARYQAAETRAALAAAKEGQ